MHCRMFNSVPGLYSLDAGSMFPKVMTIKMSPDIPKCPQLQDSSEEESHPHKSLNFDIAETQQCSNPTGSCNSEIAYLKQSVTNHQLRLKNNDPYSKTFSGQK